MFRHFSGVLRLGMCILVSCLVLRPHQRGYDAVCAHTFRRRAHLADADHRGVHPCLGTTDPCLASLFASSPPALQGVEHLASLSTLVLRQNRVKAMAEVGRLSNLPSLRDLDLRLNPITMTANTFGGGEGRNLGGSMSGSSGGGGGGGVVRGGSKRRADLLRVLPQLTSLNGRRVVEGERLPRHHQQHHRGERALSPPRQYRTRQRNPGHQPQHQQEQHRQPRCSLASSARPESEKTWRNEANDGDSGMWGAGLGLSGGRSGPSRREHESFALEAGTVASTRRRYHREHALSERRAPRPQCGGDDVQEAGEDEFARFFPAAAAVETPSVPPPPSNPGEGRVAAAAGDGDTSPRVLRSSVSPRARGGVVRGCESFVEDHSGCESVSEEGGGRDGHRYRQPERPRASEVEKQGVVAAPAVRRKRDRPGFGDVSCGPDAPAVSEPRREGRCGGGVGGDGTGGGGGGKPTSVGGHDFARDPHGPVAGVGRGAAGVRHGGRVDLGGRATAPPQQAGALAPPTAGEDGDGGDDLATLWLELGTNESLDSGRQPSLPSSLSSSVAAAATATTASVSGAARAVEAFRRSTQRLGLPSTAAANGDREGDGGSPRDDLDADNRGAPFSLGGVSCAIGESSPATVPVNDGLTTAVATTTLVEAAAPSGRPNVAASKPALDASQGGTARRCTACGGSSVNVARDADGSAIAAGVSVAAAGRVFSSACDAREMDERWWAREREFTERWAAREREFDARWAARERELDRRRREESKVRRCCHDAVQLSSKLSRRVEVHGAGAFHRHFFWLQRN